MTFARPMLLWLLALVPLAVLMLLASARSRARALHRLGDPALIARLSPAADASARRVRDALWPVALALAVVALARPQWGRAVQVVQQQGNQVIVVLDVSTSMLAQDIKPDRLSRAKAEIGRLFELLQGDEVGLVLFAGASFVQLPLTSDYATARGFLDSAQPAVISRPGTEIADALRTALAAFDMRREGGKAVFLITDGEDHAADPQVAADEARDAGVKIFAVGYGSPVGERVPQLDAAGNVIGWKVDAAGQPVISRLAERPLERLAATTGGSYWRAGVAGGAIDGLLAALDGMQRGTSEGRIETSRVERFQLFLLVAVLLMVVVEASSFVGRGAKAATQAADRGTAEPADAVGRRVRPAVPAIAVMLMLGPLASGCAPNVAADVRAGNEALAAGDTKAAAAHYAAAADAAPERSEPAYDLGVARLVDGDFGSARRDFERALVGATGDLAAMAWYNLGTAALMAGELDVAIDALSEVLRSTPADGDAKHNLELALAARNAAQSQSEAEDDRRAEGQEGQQSSDGQSRPGEEQGEGQEPGSGEEEGAESSASGPGTGTPGATGTPAAADGQASTGAGGTSTAMAQARRTPGTGSERTSGTPAAGQAGSRSGGASAQMSQEEARRLLEAIGGRARTLGEVLRMRLMAPGNPPEQDW